MKNYYRIHSGRHSLGGRPTLSKTGATALAFVAVIACATSAPAQFAPNSSNSTSAAATPSSAQPAKAQSADAKKKQKPAPKPDPAPSAATNPSAAAGPAPSQASETAQGVQAQNPLTPLWGIINENYTNLSMEVLITEPVLPLNLRRTGTS